MIEETKLKLFSRMKQLSKVAEWVNQHDLAEHVVSIQACTGTNSAWIFYRAKEEVKEEMASRAPESGGEPLQETLKFADGLTVTRLKEIVWNWPTVDRDGDPTDVRIIDSSGLSCSVGRVMSMDLRRMDDGSLTAGLALVTP